MTFIACGINHKTAPIHIRESLSPTSEQQHALLLNLMQQPNVRGAMMLSTCNRTEFYCDTDHASQILPHIFSALPEPFESYTYLYQAHEGIRHTMRVACGLDSMVLGEPQILGQMKQAYHHAHQIGTLNPHLQHVFRHIFNVSKKVRTQTDIGAYPVSIAFTAVHLMRQVFEKYLIKPLKAAHVLLIGSGDTTSLVGKYLHNQGVKNFYVASRTHDNAHLLAQTLSAQSLTISQIPDYLAKADIIVSATHCPLPFIGKDMIQQALTERHHQPMFIFDLAVPRDVESSVSTLENVFLYNIDDLQTLANEGREERQQAAFSAEEIIEYELNHYLRKERGKKARNAICHYRQYAKTARLEELSRAQKQLAQGHSPEAVIEAMSHRLMKKLLHRPSLQLRKAAYDERHDLLEYTTYLYE